MRLNVQSHALSYSLGCKNLYRRSRLKCLMWVLQIEICLEAASTSSAICEVEPVVAQISRTNCCGAWSRCKVNRSSTNLYSEAVDLLDSILQVFSLNCRYGDRASLSQSMFELIELRAITIKHLPI